ncbi:MAG: DUF4846 domain-containing protein, partial [Bacteroidales bacterium]|nr:DUF4846 domain-containing protein [Bacteroidales bacterium]
MIRLRAEYLYNTGEKDRISFHLTNGFEVNYSKWTQGYRVKVSGNSTNWILSAQPADSKGIFDKYLEFI